MGIPIFEWRTMIKMLDAKQNKKKENKKTREKEKEKGKTKIIFQSHSYLDCYFCILVVGFIVKNVIISFPWLHLND